MQVVDFALLERGSRQIIIRGWHELIGTLITLATIHGTDWKGGSCFQNGPGRGDSTM